MLTSGRMLYPAIVMLVAALDLQKTGKYACHALRTLSVYLYVAHSQLVRVVEKLWEISFRVFVYDKSNTRRRQDSNNVRTQPSHLSVTS